MSVNSMFRAVNQKDVEFELTITMTLGEWNELEQTLTTDYPAWKLGDVIRQMIRNANAHWADDGDE